MIVRTRPRIAAYVVLVLAGLVGGGGLMTFMLFLTTGPFNLVNLSFGEFPALLSNSTLCLLFFIQHSGMAQKAYRHRFRRARRSLQPGRVNDHSL